MMRMFTKNGRHARRAPLALALLMPLLAGMVAFSGPAGASVSSDVGSAFDYQLKVSLFSGPINTRGVGQVVCTNPPTNNIPAGCVPDTQAAVAASPLVTLPTTGSSTITGTQASMSGFVGPAEFFSTGAVSASTQGTTGGSGSVTSSTSIANVDASGSESFGYGPLDATTLYPKNPTGLSTTVASSCTSSETGTSGSTTITNGQLELDNGYDPLGNGTYSGGVGAHPPVRVIVATNPAPNTSYSGHIEVNGSQDFWTYVFNEQVTNSDGSLTVYAGHEYIQGPTAVGDLWFGKSQCGVKRTSKTTVTSSVNPSTVGQNVTFTATVAPVAGTGTPAGTVQFKVDGVNSGSPVTLVAGQATKAISTLSAGSHAIKAVYNASGAFLTSNGTVTQVVS